MINKYYEHIFKEYETYYGSDRNEVVNWEPTGKREITVYYDNGIRCRYDSVSKNVYSIHPRKPGEESISDDIYMKRFAWKLRSAINGSNLTKDDICELCGISNTALHGYLNGKNLPNIIKLRKLAKVLKCSVEELMNVDEWDM